MQWAQGKTPLTNCSLLKVGHPVLAVLGGGGGDHESGASPESNFHLQLPSRRKETSPRLADRATMPEV